MKKAKAVSPVNPPVTPEGSTGTISARYYYRRTNQPRPNHPGYLSDEELDRRALEMGL